MTSLGIDNTGKLVLTYGKEDTDYYVDGDPSSSYIYRAAESIFFCRLRDLFKSEMQAMFIDRENANAWSSNGLISQWDDAQSQFPEELWRLDIQRKYLRTYQGVSIDNSIAGTANPRFLTEMLNGRKKYQRRMFERNQELYMATKYFGKTATQDQIMMRFNNPETYVVKPDFTLYLTPYSDMYIGVSFYNGHKENFRAKAGVKYTVRYPEGIENADITLIYGASFIQAIDDLSACYIGDNDFSKASRLQSLVIGSDVEGYSNSYMKKISLGNNKLLEYLDIRNITGLDTVVDLSECGNMLELYAQGSGATGVIFANGGKIEKFYIPSVVSLTMKNLNYIKDFSIESYDNLATLVVENTPAIDTYEVVDTAPKLQILRLIGLVWNIEDTDILNKALSLRGINNDGGEIAQSVLAGTVYIPVIGQYDLHKYQETWTGLTVIPDDITPQFKVTFKNYDGTILDTQYVDQYKGAIDPTSEGYENRIDTPTKESSIQYDYEFAGWDQAFSNVIEDMEVFATYSEHIREYTIQYISMGTPVKIAKGKYGDNVVYDGATPTFTAAEPTAFYLFNRWDKSGFLTGDFDENGVKTVTAVFDKFDKNSKYFEGKNLCDLTPVEIYAMNKLNMAETVIKEDNEEGKNKYTIVVGNDVDYDDIESDVLIAEKTHFDGSNYIDTGIQLFKEDIDFVLAVDYDFESDNKNGATLLQCFQENVSRGIKLRYNSSDGYVKFDWNDKAENVSVSNKREMLIIRHKKGDSNVTIYKSDLDGDAVVVAEITSTKTVTGTNTLVFGASTPEEGYYEDKFVGNIHWAKIWYKDLGEDVCRSLAAWTHESITLEACGFRKYFLSDNPNKRCSFSLLASHLLDRKKIWNSTATNDGGWAKSALNKSLNTRLYSAMPSQIRSLMKQVIVYSNDGITNNSVTPVQYYTEVTASDCYITIPSILEVDSSKDYAPFDKEGTSISYLTDNGSRKRAFANGEYADYWLRSPSTEWPNYVWRVQADGTTAPITSVGAQYEHGVLIEISF